VGHVAGEDLLRARDGGGGDVGTADVVHDSGVVPVVDGGARLGLNIRSAVINTNLRSTEARSIRRAIKMKVLKKNTLKFSVGGRMVGLQPGPTSVP
jgi:hypothetical protein